MAGLTRCLVPSEVTWEGKVILMPSPYYCYIVTTETGVWWVGVTPLERSQPHGGVKAHTHTHKQIFILRFTPIVHTHKPSLTHRLKSTPQGAIVIPLVANVALKQATEISRSAERRIEMRGQVCRSNPPASLHDRMQYYVFLVAF